MKIYWSWVKSLHEYRQQNGSIRHWIQCYEIHLKKKNMCSVLLASNLTLNYYKALLRNPDWPISWLSIYNMIQKLQPNLENTITVKFELCALGYYALPDFTTLSWSWPKSQKNNVNIFTPSYPVSGLPIYHSSAGILRACSISW